MYAVRHHARSSPNAHLLLGPPLKASATAPRGLSELPAPLLDPVPLSLMPSRNPFVSSSAAPLASSRSGLVRASTALRAHGVHEATVLRSRSVDGESQR